MGYGFSADVILERGQPAVEESEGVAPVAYSPPPIRGGGWYRGDLHLHTVHSDGQRHPNELVTEALASGLDFIVSPSTTRTPQTGRGPHAAPKDCW
jgi:hypothetical protein